ncbi:MAG TPA: hypothetical protein VE951_04925 [Candidatus Angelobacter sp.]|jgi:hypothetical protein|nr:hypothetical protein [Candidatus Angelobacter sp.]
MAGETPSVDLGLVLLQRAKNPEAIASAVGMLGDDAEPRIRQVIAEKYVHLNAEPRRRDSGCFQRMALVRALRGRATVDDVPLLETALWTIEIIGRFDAASDLRAAALVTLNDVDGSLACFHAVRLLSDAHEMSGEPALTAARLLAAREQFLPLYQYATNGDGRAEILAECLRGLTGLPVSLVLKLLGRYRDEQDETIIVGLFDLLLAHPSRASFAEFVASFLGRTQSTDLYRFVVSSIVATRDPALIALLERPDGPSEDSPKGKILREALAVMKA